MFKTGDNVVCIDDTGVQGTLKNGDIYVVKDGEKSPGNILVEGKLGDIWYHRGRFKLVKKTSEKCTCDIVQLMAYGCKCGQIERERVNA